jgi:aminopeptidase N
MSQRACMLARVLTLTWFGLVAGHPPPLKAAATFTPPATNETPLAYRLDLTIDPAKPCFTAHAEIDLRLAQPTQLIHLDGQDLQVAHVEARVRGKLINATYRQLDPEGHVEVKLARPLPAGEATLAFSYAGPLQEGPSALFHVKVKDEWFVSSEFEPAHARRVFPSFDQLNYKTPFTVSLTVPSGMTALSAMPEIGLQHQGALERHRFAPSFPLPTYLISFAVGPFVSVSGTVAPNAERNQPLPLRIFAPRGDAPKLAYTLAQSARIIGMLEDFLGVAYPYPKIDQIGSPLMRGGMENAGAIVYGTDQLFPGQDAPPRSQQYFGILVAHELAHQWFGDFVTPLWWSDIWLKESFAHWTALTLNPRWLPGVSTAVAFQGFGDMDDDSLPNSRPMHMPLDEATLKLGYNFIYGKGSLLMVNAYIGEDRLRAGITDFLRTHAHGSATAGDFFDALGHAAGSPEISAAMRTFTDQPGVPLLEIQRDSTSMVVTQRRYAPLGVTFQPALWSLPFCYRIGQQRACTLLKQTTRIDIAGDAALMPNAGGHGYFRFNLPDPEWHKLIAAADTLSVGEGIALNDSLWAGFRGGYLSPRWLVEALPRLAANPSADVAMDGADRWMELEDRGLIPAGALPAYRAMLSDTYGPMLNKLGFDVAAGHYDQEGLAHRQQRVQLVKVLAAGAQQPETVAALNRATDHFLAGDAAALDPALLKIALQIRVRTGGRAAAQAVLAKAAASENGDLRPGAITALGSSDDPDIATWLLAQLGHSGLRVPDEMDLVQTLLQYSNTQRVAVEWLRSNYARLAAMELGRSWSPWIAADLCSENDAAEIERIMRPTAPKGTSNGAALDQVAQRINTCAALRSARSGDVAQALGAPLSPHAMNPPSTLIVAPVMKSASELARNATAAAISSGLP